MWAAHPAVGEHGASHPEGVPPSRRLRSEREILPCSRTPTVHRWNYSSPVDNSELAPRVGEQARLALDIAAGVLRRCAEDLDPESYDAAYLIELASELDPRSSSRRLHLVPRPPE